MKFKLSDGWRLVAMVFAAVLVAACTPGPGSPPGSGYGAADDSGPYKSTPTPSTAASPREAPPAEKRPGLATGFGKEVKDPWQEQGFVRKGTEPAGLDRIYYNDRDGIRAMERTTAKVEPLQRAAGELVEWGIKGRFGWLPAYKSGHWGSGDRRFVEGSHGQPYSIYIKNRCKSRLEVVLSVDGLDVIDGKPASFSKRGYVIAPGKALEVKGWRTGRDRVARFEFSSVGASYANQRHGDARNAGLVGLAVFTEKGVDPWTWMPREVKARDTARPFAEAP